jgi:DGQHR domain-containing protein
VMLENPIYSHDDEIEMTKSIFRKSGLDSISKVDVVGAQQITDVDLFGIFENSIFLVECVGQESFGKKAKETATELNVVIDRFDAVLKSIVKTKPVFYSKHKQQLNAPNRIFRKLLVTLSKETKKSIASEQLSMCEQEGLAVWTREEMYYFQKVSDCTYDHCRYEILDSLRVRPDELSEDQEDAPILVYLGFGREVRKNLHILNFVVPVKTLLRRSTIQRLRDSSSEDGYQRLLNKDKLRRMRGYLAKGIAAYPNNIICVLHGKTTIQKLGSQATINVSGPIASRSEILDREAKNNLYLVELPNVYNAFEIIDGQHRLFSFAQTKYHLFEEFEDNAEKAQARRDDEKIAELAKTSYIVVTAIHSDEEAVNKDWANPGKLFYEVNTTQTKISPEDLIDLIERLYPKNSIARANRLLKRLNEKGVLENKIKVKFWQDYRIKRTSLISYSGLKDVFDERKRSYRIFREAYDRQNVFSSYLDFCYVLINNYLYSFTRLAGSKYPKLLKKMGSDLTMEKYYLFSAVEIGAMIRLLRHFVSDNDKEFRIIEKLDSVLAKGRNKDDRLAENIDNAPLQKLFVKGLRRITNYYTFTRKEFDKQKNWGPNRWAQMESDLFYRIRGKKRLFGDASLIAPKYRR